MSHDEHDDDAQVGRVLSRREALALLGAASAAALAGCSPQPTSPVEPTSAAPAAPTDVAVLPGEAAAPATSSAASSAEVSGLPTCIVRPEQTEGPYFVDGQLERADIRLDPSTGTASAGAPLRLAFRVSQVEVAGACTPLAGAHVDVWHCDAAGVYSGVGDIGSAGDAGGTAFLRGYQVTGADGRAEFLTVYPGWYPGRTVHIHFKIRTDPAADVGSEFTSQLFFDERLTDAVYAEAPYAARGERDVRNEDDGIYRGGGDQLLLTVAQDGDGYATTFDIGLQMA